MDQEKLLEIFKKTKALLKGHFLLSSGLHSDQYLQCALVLQHPEYARDLGRSLADRFKEESINVVIGPALGGIITLENNVTLASVPKSTGGDEQRE